MVIIRTDSTCYDNSSQNKFRYVDDSELTYDNIIRFAKELKSDMPGWTSTTLEMGINDFCKLINEAKNCERKEACEFHIGDEVEFKSILASSPVMKGYVVHVVSEGLNTSVEILSKNHGTFIRPAHNVSKTGRISNTLIRLLDDME